MKSRWLFHGASPANPAHTFHARTGLTPQEVGLAETFIPLSHAQKAGLSDSDIQHLDLQRSIYLELAYGDRVVWAINKQKKKDF